MGLVEVDSSFTGGITTMADATRTVLAEPLRKAETEPGLDVLREGGRALAEAIMDPEIERRVGAKHHAHSDALTG